jgi:hypothetical protein
MQPRRRTRKRLSNFGQPGNLEAFSSSNRQGSVESTSYIFLAHLDRDDHWGRDLCGLDGRASKETDI